MANVVTPKFKMGYPNLFKPRKNEMNRKDEYSVVALFDKGEDLSVLKKAAQEAIVKKWGADKSKWPQNLRTPFRDQGEKGKIDEVTGKKILPPGHEEGAIFLNLRSQQKPGVVDENVQPILDEQQLYAGCYARASVSCYAYDHLGNRGISFGLGNIQKVADGEPMGGKLKAEMEFAPIPGAKEANSTDLFN